MKQELGETRDEMTPEERIHDCLRAFACESLKPGSPAVHSQRSKWFAEALIAAVREHGQAEYRRGLEDAARIADAEHDEQERQAKIQKDHHQGRVALWGEERALTAARIADEIRALSPSKTQPALSSDGGDAKPATEARDAQSAARKGKAGPRVVPGASN